MLKKLLLIPVLLWAAPLARAQAPKVGDRLPPVVLEGLSQTPAASFADFYGRAVVLEFFAHWCGPCALSVPHLNELQEKYGSRGFSVVAVTSASEDAEKTVRWIEKRGAKYAYGYDPEGALHSLFQIRGIPFSVLIDPFGTVVWTGHPKGLSDELIERTLAGAVERPVWEWPEGARELARTLQRGEFAAALQAASALPVQEGFDARALVRGRMDALVAQFERLVERRDYPEALQFGERSARELAGLPEGERLAARAGELRADPEVRALVAALERLDELEKRADAVRSIAEAEKLRVELVAFLNEQVGKKTERRAKALLDAIDRGLERARRKS